MRDVSNGNKGSESCNGHRPCGGGYGRREFLQIGLGTVAASAVGLPTMAGPFEENEYLKTIPADKKLDPEWVASLSARGEKETYSTAEALRNIGMPVGGLFAGTVYLGGDGQLWLWDIFNRDQEGILPRKLTRPVPNASPEAKLVANMTRGGHNYLEPASPQSPFEQTFSVLVGGRVRKLNQAGFSKMTFDGRYPIGRVKYEDADCPVTIELEAFSPFLPMNAADSSLPVTVMSYTVENTGEQDTTVDIVGRLQNPVCLDAEDSTAGLLRNQVVSAPRVRGVVCRAELPEKTEQEIVRDDILLEDFEKSDYEGWEVEGDAFGKQPVPKAKIPDYQGDVSGEGNRVVNSHASAPGENVGEKDGCRERSRVAPLRSSVGFCSSLSEADPTRADLRQPPGRRRGRRIANGSESQPDATRIDQRRPISRPPRHRSRSSTVSRADGGMLVWTNCSYGSPPGSPATRFAARLRHDGNRTA